MGGYRDACQAATGVYEVMMEYWLAIPMIDLEALITPSPFLLYADLLAKVVGTNAGM